MVAETPKPVAGGVGELHQNNYGNRVVTEHRQVRALAKSFLDKFECSFDPSLEWNWRETSIAVVFAIPRDGRDGEWRLGSNRADWENRVCRAARGSIALGTSRACLYDST